MRHVYFGKIAGGISSGWLALDHDSSLALSAIRSFELLITLLPITAFDFSSRMCVICLTKSSGKA